MRLKKVVSITCEVVALGLIILFAGVKVTHAEVEANAFSFSFCGESGDIYSYSTPQWKDDYSSSWINYMNGVYPIQMSIVAYDNGIIENIQVQKKLYYPGQIDTIYNWVRESGYYKAVLKGEAAIDPCYSGRGVWSPDSDEW